MAIQTRGFGVDVIPRYTPVDPNLVGLDSSKLLSGIYSSIQIADSLAKLKAMRNEAGEKAQTREERVAAKKAELARQTLADTTSLNNIPILGQLEGAKANAGLSLVTPSTEAELSKLALNKSQSDASMGNVKALADTQLSVANLEGARAKGALGNVELATEADRAALDLAKLKSQSALTAVAPKTAAEIAAANAAKGNAEIEVATQPDRLTNARFAESYKADLQPSQFRVEMNKLADQIENAADDNERKRLLQDAQIELTNAHAGYYEDASSRGKKPDPIAQLEKLHSIENGMVGKIKNMMETKVPDPLGKGLPVTLSQYLAMTRKPGGTDDQKAQSGFIFKSDVQRNPEAEAVLDNVRQIYKDLERARDATTKFSSGIDFGANSPINPITAAPVPSTASRAGTPPTVKSRAEFDKLPKGAQFLGVDGKLYTKP